MLKEYSMKLWKLYSLCLLNTLIVFDILYFLVPQQPREINASNINSKNLTLSWNLPKPSPGDTTYTIYVEEATDDKGTVYTLLQTLKNHGVYKDINVYV